jgi:YVTN family beta-propeller protein
LRININEASPAFLETDLIDSASNPFGAFFDNPVLYVAATADALQYNVNSFVGYSRVDLAVTTNEGRELDANDTRQLALSPSGNTVFVTNEVDNMLILNAAQFLPPSGPGVTDLGTEPVDYIVVGTTSTRGIAVDSTFLYVVDNTPPALKIMTDAGLAPVSGPPKEISSSSLQVASIPVGDDPGEVIVDEADGRAYVSNTGSDDISVIDLDLQQEIARISVNTTPDDEEDDDDPFAGDQPFGMTLVEIGGTKYLYVANFITNLIFVINADTLTVANSFP